MTINAKGTNLQTNVIDWNIPPAFEPKKLINMIEAAATIAIGMIVESLIPNRFLN